jgi:hypothetical protein
MSQAVVGALRVTLGLDSAQFTEGLSAAKRTLRKASQDLQSIGTGMAAVGTGLTAAITAPLVGLGAMAVSEASEMRDALGQVNAALTSMGDIGARSLDQLKTQADALASTSLFEDDQILRQVTANMLTFGNIAGDAFDRAQQAAVDLSTRLGTDLQSAALMVGKALNDPVAGLAALRRVGIQFTEEQQAQIRAMQGVGDTAGAQAVMLAELERQFGGSAEAARNAANPMERMRLSLAAMAGDIGTILLPFVDRIAVAFSGLTERFGNLSPGMQQFVVVAGLVAAALGPLLIAGGALVASLGVLLPIVGAIGAPFLAVAAAVAAVGVAFWVFRDDIIPILQSFAASLQENLGPKIAPLWEAIKAAVAAVGTIFTAVLGDGSPGSATETVKVFGEVIARIFGAAVDLITGAINVIANIMRAFGALLRGDFSAMWGYLGQAVMAAARGIANAFQSLFPEVVSWVRQTYEGVKSWLLDRFTDVVRGVVEKIGAVKDAFFKLYDAVVGNSYIPDLVTEIADWMGPRLQDAMVTPAIDAIDETSTAFGAMATNVSSEIEGLFKSISSKDWKGVLGGVLDIFGKAGGDSIWGELGRVGSSLLGGKIPGFKTGGSFKVGGSGGADSQLMQFRATPGEMVDIRRPGQDAGGGMVVHVNPSPYFDVQVEKVATPIAGRAGVQSFSAARSQVPADQARRARFNLGAR